MDVVERRQSLRLDEFQNKYVKPGIPVVITDVVQHWPAFRLWSQPESFADRVGEVDVPLTKLNDGPRNYYFDIQPEPTPFRNSVRRIFGNEPPGYYLHETQLIELAPQLREDIVFPFPELEVTHGPFLFWVGSAGTVSRIHFDLGHNFVCQIRGCKRFRLFGPQQTYRLYPPLYGPEAKHSPVSTTGVTTSGDTSFAKYPHFARARYMEVCLRAGDMLFLPSFWWHQVLTDEPSVMMTWFWNTPSMQRDKGRLLPCSMAFASGDWGRSRALIAEFENAFYRDVVSAALARLLVERGNPGLARQVLSGVTDVSFADEMADLFEAPEHLAASSA